MLIAALRHQGKIINAEDGIIGILCQKFRKAVREERVFIFVAKMIGNDTVCYIALVKAGVDIGLCIGTPFENK